MCRSGEKGTGESRRRSASLMAVGVDDRWNLIERLDNMHAGSVASAEAELMFLASPTDTFRWFDVCKRLAETETNHERAADLSQNQLLRYRALAGQPMQRSDLALLHLPHLHRAAAAIGKQEFDRAEKHIDTMLSINRVDPRIADVLLPLLKAGGRNAQADMLVLKLSR